MEPQQITLHSSTPPAELDSAVAPAPLINGNKRTADEWLGTLFFQAHVALNFAQEGKEGNALEAGVREYMRQHRYEDSIRKVQASRTFPTEMAGIQEHDKALFQILGRAYRTCSESEANTLLQNILTPFNSGDSPDSGVRLDPRQDPRSQVSQEPDSHSGNRPDSGVRLNPLQDPRSQISQEPDSHSDSEDVDALPMYTLRLNQIGQERGRKLERSFSMISYDPLKWQATVRFGRYEASGTARSKKIAGHLAAKGICLQMRQGL